MAAFYSIIQFVPDPVADERVNAGVVVFDDERVLVRFVQDWGRLQRFGNKDVTFLKTFAKDFESLISPIILATRERINGQILRSMADNWKNAIQLTPPKGSLLDLETLLSDTEARFLANDRRSVIARPFTRSSMKRFAFEATRLAFIRLGHPRASELVHRNFEITGAIEHHPFSMAIANGRPLVAAEVFSFVGADRRNQERDIHATAWAFEDVKKSHSDLRLAALVMKGEEEPPVYEQALRIFNGLSIEIVQKNDIDSWAEGIATQFVAAHP